MQILGNKTVIRHTYENTVATRLFDEVIVVTDSKFIFDEIVENGGYAIMSKLPHESGSDRIAEAVAAKALVDERQRQSDWRRVVENAAWLAQTLTVG